MNKESETQLYSVPTENQINKVETSDIKKGIVDDDDDDTNDSIDFAVMKQTQSADSQIPAGPMSKKSNVFDTDSESSQVKPSTSKNESPELMSQINIVKLNKNNPFNSDDDDDEVITSPKSPQNSKRRSKYDISSDSETDIEGDKDDKSFNDTDVIPSTQDMIKAAANFERSVSTSKDEALSESFHLHISETESQYEKNYSQIDLKTVVNQKEPELKNNQVTLTTLDEDKSLLNVSSKQALCVSTISTDMHSIDMDLTCTSSKSEDSTRRETLKNKKEHEIKVCSTIEEVDDQNSFGKAEVPQATLQGNLKNKTDDKPNEENDIDYFQNCSNSPELYIDEAHSKEPADHQLTQKMDHSEPEQSAKIDNFYLQPTQCFTQNKNQQKSPIDDFYLKPTQLSEDPKIEMAASTSKHSNDEVTRKNENYQNKNSKSQFEDQEIEAVASTSKYFNEETAKENVQVVCDDLNKNKKFEDETNEMTASTSKCQKAEITKENLLEAIMDDHPESRLSQSSESIENQMKDLFYSQRDDGFSCTQQLVSTLEENNTSLLNSSFDQSNTSTFLSDTVIEDSLIDVFVSPIKLPKRSRLTKFETMNVDQKQNESISSVKKNDEIGAGDKKSEDEEEVANLEDDQSKNQEKCKEPEKSKGRQGRASRSSKNEEKGDTLENEECNGLRGSKTKSKEDKNPEKCKERQSRTSKKNKCEEKGNSIENEELKGKGLQKGDTSRNEASSLSDMADDNEKKTKEDEIKKGNGGAIEKVESVALSTQSLVPEKINLQTSKVKEYEKTKTVKDTSITPNNITDAEINKEIKKGKNNENEENAVLTPLSTRNSSKTSLSAIKQREQICNVNLIDEPPETKGAEETAQTLEIAFTDAVEENAVLTNTRKSKRSLKNVKNCNSEVKEIKDEVLKNRKRLLQDRSTLDEIKFAKLDKNADDKEREEEALNKPKNRRNQKGMELDSNSTASTSSSEIMSTTIRKTKSNTEKIKITVPKPKTDAVEIVEASTLEKRTSKRSRQNTKCDQTSNADEEESAAPLVPALSAAGSLKGKAISSRNRRNVKSDQTSNADGEETTATSSPALSATDSSRDKRTSSRNRRNVKSDKISNADEEEMGSTSTPASSTTDSLKETKTSTRNRRNATSDQTLNADGKKTTATLTPGSSTADSSKKTKTSTRNRRNATNDQTSTADEDETTATLTPASSTGGSSTRGRRLSAYSRSLVKDQTNQESNKSVGGRKRTAMPISEEETLPSKTSKKVLPTKSVGGRKRTVTSTVAAEEEEPPTKSVRQSVEMATPERNKRKLKPKVVFTMLDNPQLESAVRQLGGSVVDSEETSTVLVTKTVQRTRKMLCAVGHGKPVCSPQWITDSKKKSSFLDPWDYILEDKTAETKWEFSLRESLNRSVNFRLLENYTFQVCLKDAHVVDVLKGAIESCGGKYVTKGLGKCSTDNLVVISKPELKSRYAKLLKENPRIIAVDPEAIFDGTLRQELRFDKHLIS